MKKLLYLLALMPTLLLAQTPLKFSELQSATTLGGTEIVPGVQGGSNRKISINQIRAYSITGLVPNTITVNGYQLTNNITLLKGDLNLGSVDNTSDANKPISTATQTALNGKQTLDSDLTTVAGLGSSNQQLRTNAAGTAVEWFTGVTIDADFTALTFGSTTNWNCGSAQIPLAKVTSTGSFAINMTNVKSGSLGYLILTTNTASAITLTFDTDFSNKRTGLTGQETFTTWTFPASTGKEYILQFVSNGTDLHWVVSDYSYNPAATPFAFVSRAASQSISNNTTTAVSFDTEIEDNSSIWTSSPNPTRFTAPGSGNKIATIMVYGQYTVNATGIRRLSINKNGAVISTGNLLAQQAAISTNDITIVSTFQFPCVGGDYFEVMLYQNSGGALNCTSQASIKFEDR